MGNCQMLKKLLSYLCTVRENRCEEELSFPFCTVPFGIKQQVKIRCPGVPDNFQHDVDRIRPDSQSGGRQPRALTPWERENYQVLQALLPENDENIDLDSRRLG